MSKKTIIVLFVILILLAVAGLIFLPDVLEKSKPFLVSDQLNQQAPSNLIIPNKMEPQNTPPPVEVIKRQGLLYFSPSIINVKKDEEFSVSLMANTFAQELAGLDVVLKYDQSRLKFSKIVNVAGLNLIFPKEPPENLSFSLLAPADQSFVGEFKTADVYFQALEIGQTDISFIAQQGSTGDTNLIAAGIGEILSQADGFSVIVE